MARVKIATEVRERPSADIEIARLRDLDVEALRARWEAAHGKKAPVSPPPASAVSGACVSIAGRPAWRPRCREPAHSGSIEFARAGFVRAADANRRANTIRPGTVLGREWNGQMHRVAVMADGFAWNGATYPSLSKVAFAITGTRWNGPKFFGLRDSLPIGERERS